MEWQDYINPKKKDIKKGVKTVKQYLSDIDFPLGPPLEMPTPGISEEERLFEMGVPQFSDVKNWWRSKFTPNRKPQVSSISKVNQEPPKTSSVLPQKINNVIKNQEDFKEQEVPKEPPLTPTMTSVYDPVLKRNVEIPLYGDEYLSRYKREKMQGYKSPTDEELSVMPTPSQIREEYSRNLDKIIAQNKENQMKDLIINEMYAERGRNASQDALIRKWLERPDVYRKELNALRSIGGFRPSEINQLSGVLPSQITQDIEQQKMNQTAEQLAQSFNLNKATIQKIMEDTLLAKRQRETMPTYEERVAGEERVAKAGIRPREEVEAAKIQADNILRSKFMEIMSTVEGITPEKIKEQWKTYKEIFNEPIGTKTKPSWEQFYNNAKKKNTNLTDEELREAYNDPNTWR